MNRKVLVFYYIISIAFLLVLVALGGYRIRARGEENLKASRQDLEALRVAALSTALAEGRFDSEYFSSAMQEHFRRTARLRLLAVYAREEGLYYLLSDGRRLLSDGPGTGSSWTGAPRYNLQPLVHARVSIPLNPGMRAGTFLPAGLMLDGVFLRLSREDFYPILRELFFVVLVYLILTTILLLAAALSPSTLQSRSPRGELQPRRLAASRSPEGGMQADPNNPGLYSPETGLGWRDFLPQRLSQELERAASFDQDLAFMLVGLRPRQGPASTDRRVYLFRQLGRYTLESFPIRDLDFEYDAHAVAVILPDRSLDQGLEAARAFQRKLLQASWPGTGGVRAAVGLSSRSGRLISGTRLLIEAGRSLKKAESTGANQIIAFRADPQKFRQVLFSGRGE